MQTSADILGKDKKQEQVRVTNNKLVQKEKCGRVRSNDTIGKSLATVLEFKVCSVFILVRFHGNSYKENL